MSVAGLLLGVINVALVVAILLLIGLVAAWFATMLGFPIPDNVRRMYLVIVLIVVLYMIVAMLFGLPYLTPVRPL